MGCVNSRPTSAEGGTAVQNIHPSVLASILAGCKNEQEAAIRLSMLSQVAANFSSSQTQAKGRISSKDDDVEARVQPQASYIGVQPSLASDSIAAPVPQYAVHRSCLSSTTLSHIQSANTSAYSTSPVSVEYIQAKLSNSSNDSSQPPSRSSPSHIRVVRASSTNISAVQEWNGYKVLSPIKEVATPAESVAASGRLMFQGSGDHSKAVPVEAGGNNMNSNVAAPSVSIYDREVEPSVFQYLTVDQNKVPQVSASDLSISPAASPTAGTAPDVGIGDLPDLSRRVVSYSEKDSYSVRNMQAKYPRIMNATVSNHDEVIESHQSLVQIKQVHVHPQSMLTQHASDSTAQQTSGTTTLMGMDSNGTKPLAKPSLSDPTEGTPETSPGSMTRPSPIHSPRHPAPSSFTHGSPGPAMMYDPRLGPSHGAASPTAASTPLAVRVSSADPSPRTSATSVARGNTSPRAPALPVKPALKRDSSLGLTNLHATTRPSPLGPFASSEAAIRHTASLNAEELLAEATDRFNVDAPPASPRSVVPASPTAGPVRRLVRNTSSRNSKSVSFAMPDTSSDRSSHDDNKSPSDLTTMNAVRSAQAQEFIQAVQTPVPMPVPVVQPGPGMNMGMNTRSTLDSQDGMVMRNPRDAGDSVGEYSEVRGSGMMMMTMDPGMDFNRGSAFSMVGYAGAGISRSSTTDFTRHSPAYYSQMPPTQQPHMLQTQHSMVEFMPSSRGSGYVHSRGMPARSHPSSEALMYHRAHTTDDFSNVQAHHPVYMKKSSTYGMMPGEAFVHPLDAPHASSGLHAHHSMDMAMLNRTNSHKMVHAHSYQSTGPNVHPYSPQSMQHRPGPYIHHQHSASSSMAPSPQRAWIPRRASVGNIDTRYMGPPGAVAAAPEVPRMSPSTLSIQPYLEARYREQQMGSVSPAQRRADPASSSRLATPDWSRRSFTPPLDSTTPADIRLLRVAALHRASSNV